MDYCLLCDSYISVPTYKLHNYHRYYEKYFIEYYNGINNKPNYIDSASLIISLELNVDIPKESKILFKGLHIWEMAEPIYNKLKVFK